MLCDEKTRGQEMTDCVVKTHAMYAIVFPAGEEFCLPST